MVPAKNKFMDRVNLRIIDSGITLVSSMWYILIMSSNTTNLR